MKSNILDKNIDFLDINEKTINKLNLMNINTVNDLWPLNRKTLKEYNLSDKEIKAISIQLQLNGLDLNKRKY